MSQTILLTSFDIWEAHHISNSSDVLLEQLIIRNLLSKDIHLLRKLPVHFQLAPEQTIAKIEEIHPDVVICCGMAETRKWLTIETNGKLLEDVIQTEVDVNRLITGLTVTQPSHDAGNFVCNYLYYSVLKHIRDQRLSSQCIFVHVPMLNDLNLQLVVDDFWSIVQMV
jgi:pyroglutamyl-peptidase